MGVLKKLNPTGNRCKSGLGRGSRLLNESYPLEESELGWQQAERDGLRKDLCCFPVSKEKRRGTPNREGCEKQHADNMHLGIGSAEGFGRGEYKKPTNDAPDDLSNSTRKADSQSNVPLETSTPHRSHSLPHVHSPPRLRVSATGMALQQRMTRQVHPAPLGYCIVCRDLPSREKLVGSQGLSTGSRRPPPPWPAHRRAGTVSAAVVPRHGTGPKGRHLSG